MVEPGTENELVVSGTAGFAADAPLDLSFQSTLAATWAGLFLPELPAGGGRRPSRRRARHRGQPGAERRGGGAGRPIDRAGVRAVDRRHQRLPLLQSRPHLDRAACTPAWGNNGKLLFTGGLDLPRPGRGFAYQVNVKARDVSARFPEFLNNRGDADLSVISSDGGLVIQGDIRLERSLYVQDINVDLIELIRGLFQRQRLELAETGAFETTTQLNIAISGRHDVLHVRNNVANLQGDVRLDVRGTLARAGHLRRRHASIPAAP